MQDWVLQLWNVCHSIHSDEINCSCENIWAPERIQNNRREYSTSSRFDKQTYLRVFQSFPPPDWKRLTIYTYTKTKNLINSNTIVQLLRLVELEVGYTLLKFVKVFDQSRPSLHV